MTSFYWDVKPQLNQLIVNTETVTSAGWQVTLCDFVRHVSSRSGEEGCISSL